MFGSCKVCAEKDKRVSDLHREIDFLRSAVFPSNDSDPNNVPLVHLEADGALSGQQHVIVVPDAKEEDASVDEIMERDRILAGTY